MHQNRYAAKVYYKKKLQRLLDESSGYPRPVWNNGDRLIRIWRGNHQGNRYRLCKRISNRKVRKYRGDLSPHGNNYRKVYDYWWTVD